MIYVVGGGGGGGDGGVAQATLVRTIFSPTQFAGSHHLYALNWLRISDRRAVTANDSTLRPPLHGSVGDKPTKLIAPARGRWCDFLRRPPSPPLIDAPGDLTKATESMYIASLSLLLASPLVPLYFLMHIQERASSRVEEKKRNSLRARIRRLLGVYCSEGSRISRVLISFRAPGYLSGAAREHERARQRAATVAAAREYPPVFCIILILCATPCEETRNKRPHDDVASSRRPFTFSKIKRECLSVMLHGNSLGVAKGDGIPSEFHDAAASPQSPL